MATFNPPLPVQPDHSGPALRVAATIGVVKWIVVALHALVAALAIVAGLFEGEAYYLLIGIGSALLALIAWVMFGWAQHTLGMLAHIARNTGR